jgi:LasA protease
VAKEYSVNPRLLLTLLEFRSGWVTNPNPPGETLKDPLRMVDPARPDLYRQLSWAANAFNRGYYLWKINAISDYLLQDGSHVPPANTINAGTAAVQSTLGVLMGRSEWDAAVSSSGWAAVFQRLFGYPFDYTLDPLVPANLTQPAFQLPFKNDETWSFTGGPHGGWGEGSAWAALDFAPPGEGHGCVVPSNWVVAVANGKVVRSGDGVVVLDLDGDGYEQTGWTVLYLHIASEGRAPLGAELKAGDPIGHPSCEGGVANATHVHLARRYNGEWIAADGPVPFNLDGWISSGTGVEYNGKLIRNNVVVEAWDHYTPENQIHH